MKAKGRFASIIGVVVVCMAATAPVSAAPPAVCATTSYYP